MFLARNDSAKIGKSMNAQLPNRPRYSLYRLSKNEIMQFNRNQLNLNKLLSDQMEPKVISVMIKNANGGNRSSHSHSGANLQHENESSNHYKNSRASSSNSNMLNAANRNLPFEIAILNDTGADIIENNIKIVMKEYAGGNETAAERRGSLNIFNKSNKIVDNYIEINPIMPASMTPNGHRLSHSVCEKPTEYAHSPIEAAARYSSFVIIDKASITSSNMPATQRPSTLFNANNMHGHQEVNDKEREGLARFVAPVETPIRTVALKQVGLLTRLNRYFQEYMPNARGKNVAFRSKRTESKTPILFYKDGICTTRLTLNSLSDKNFSSLIKAQRYSGKSVTSRNTVDTKLSCMLVNGKRNSPKRQFS